MERIWDTLHHDEPSSKEHFCDIKPFQNVQLRDNRKNVEFKQISAWFLVDWSMSCGKLFHMIKGSILFIIF